MILSQIGAAYALGGEEYYFEEPSIHERSAEETDIIKFLHERGLDKKQKVQLAKRTINNNDKYSVLMLFSNFSKCKKINCDLLIIKNISSSEKEIFITGLSNGGQVVRTHFYWTDGDLYAPIWCVDVVSGSDFYGVVSGKMARIERVEGRSCSGGNSQQ